MTTKKNSKKTMTSLDTDLKPIGGANPLPAVGAPDVPFDSAPAVDGRRIRLVQASQVAQAPTAVEELRGSDTYKQHLGEKVISAEELASTIAFASGWSALDTKADAWKAYTHQQTMRAWDFALGQISKVHRPVAGAVENDPALEAKMPKFVALVMASNIKAERAAVTRRVVKAAKEEAVAKVTATQPAPSAPAITPASAVPTK